VKAKHNYEEKIEHKYLNADQRAVWDGMKLMAGIQESTRCTLSLNGYTSNVCLANELNKFYLRFDADDDNNKRIKINKSPGPDNISGKVLRACSVQLSGIFSQIFNTSVKTQTV